jgi:SCY1-like protein 2
MCIPSWIRGCRRTFSGSLITSVSASPSSRFEDAHSSHTAPEYALDSSLSPANDLYSLGCLLYAVHLGGNPPFKTHNSLQGLRECVERELVPGQWRGGARWTQASDEVKDILSKLITRTPQTRLSLASLASHPYFASSLVLNILTFLDPTNFASKSREEKATFLKGLLRVLPGFSEKLRRRKLLPGLLDEVRRDVRWEGL